MDKTPTFAVIRSKRRLAYTLVFRSSRGINYSVFIIEKGKGVASSSASDELVVVYVSAMYNHKLARVTANPIIRLCARVVVYSSRLISSRKRARTHLRLMVLIRFSTTNFYTRHRRNHVRLYIMELIAVAPAGCVIGELVLNNDAMNSA